jgi:hypothetical protein
MKPWEKEHDEDPSQEGGMALSSLKRTAKMARELVDLIGPNDTLPGWVQAKLTTVYEDLNDVHGYMMGLDRGESQSEVQEAINQLIKRHRR